jgi:hypothetical protein
MCKWERCGVNHWDWVVCNTELSETTDKTGRFSEQLSQKQCHLNQEMSGKKQSSQGKDQKEECPKWKMYTCLFSTRHPQWAQSQGKGKTPPHTHNARHILSQSSYWSVCTPPRVKCLRSGLSHTHTRSPKAVHVKQKWAAWKEQKKSSFYPEVLS